jgi:UDP-glucose:(heptosyl)LPS alpha-1,3-glucosyltransferase
MVLCSSPKIALVIDRFDGRRGGAALWTRGFAAWLAAHGCDVHILARHVGPAEALLPITFHPISVKRLPLAFAGAVSKRLATIKPLVSHDMGAAVGCDVFQPHVGSTLACWNGSVASYAPWRRPVKRLCGFSPRYHRIRQLIAAQYNGGSTAYIAVSHKVACDMQALHHVPAARIHVVHNGVDLSRFSSPGVCDSRAAIRRCYGIRNHDVLVIAVAHNFRLKGIPRLIRAVQELYREGNPVRLLVCGGRTRAIDSSAAGHDAIIDCGRIDDVAPYYAAADICVHPTFYDACSLVTLEAMAAGLPVITTRANGASELIAHDVNGVVLEVPHDERTLVAALRPLVQDANLRSSLGSAGRRAVQEHSAERNYLEIAAVYADVLALRSKAAKSLEPLFTSGNPPPIDIQRSSADRETVTST